MFDLTGKTAFVTGGASGIGQAIAVALAMQGADVAIADLPNASFEETTSRIKGFNRRCLNVKMDVRDRDQREEGIAFAEKEFKGIDILVNNAGINRPAPGLEVTEENWDMTYDINVKAGFFIAQRIAPGMIEKGWGRVIFISSQSGLVGIPGQPVYCSAKGAIVQLVRTLGLEWAKYGVTVNSIAPTFIRTKLTEKRLEQKEFRDFVLGKIPGGKLAEVEDVAHAAVFLASTEAGMVNCHTLSVDGGWTAW